MSNVKKNKVKVYAIVGYYDNENNYREDSFEELKLKDIDPFISENIYLDKDITVQVAPRVEVRVFARKKESIDEFLRLENNQDYVRAIFDVFSEHNGPTTDYIYTTINLKDYEEQMK